MNRLRDQLLACAALALNQYGRTAGRYLRDEIEEAKHRFAFAHDIFEVVSLLQRSLQLHNLFFSAVASDCGANVGQQLLVVPRLLDKVLRTRADGINDVAHCTERRNHDDWESRLRLQDARQQFDAGLPRQCKIKQQQIVFVAREQIQTGRAITSHVDRRILRASAGYRATRGSHVHRR